jgi:hypothetical protein
MVFRAFTVLAVILPACRAYADNDWIVHVCDRGLAVRYLAIIECEEVLGSQCSRPDFDGISYCTCDSYFVTADFLTWDHDWVGHGDCPDWATFSVRTAVSAGDSQTVKPGRPGDVMSFDVNSFDGRGTSGLLKGPADFNMDGHIGSDDLFAFLNAFLLGDPTADFNLSGRVDSTDLFAFLAEFFAGS